MSSSNGSSTRSTKPGFASRSGETRSRSTSSSTSRGRCRPSSPLASADQIRWFHDEGGEAVSFGSDAHNSSAVGQKFDLAVDVVEAAGFRPGRDRFGIFWRR